jgi:hypothetical protein
VAELLRSTLATHRRWALQLAEITAATVLLVVALALLTASGGSGPPRTEQAQASGYCSAGCAIGKANARIRGSYSCTHLNYVCHVGVPAVDWLNGNWGWSGNVGRRCRRVLTQDFSCHAITSGGQVRKRDGAWRGFWVRFG